MGKSNIYSLDAFNLEKAIMDCEKQNSIDLEQKKQNIRKTYNRIITKEKVAKDREEKINNFIKISKEELNNCKKDSKKYKTLNYGIKNNDLLICSLCLKDDMFLQDKENTLKKALMEGNEFLIDAFEIYGVNIKQAKDKYKKTIFDELCIITNWVDSDKKNKETIKRLMEYYNLGINAEDTFLGSIDYLIEGRGNSNTYERDTLSKYEFNMIKFLLECGEEVYFRYYYSLYYCFTVLPFELLKLLIKYDDKLNEEKLNEIKNIIKRIETKEKYKLHCYKSTDEHYGYGRNNSQTPYFRSIMNNYNDVWKYIDAVQNQIKEVNYGKIQKDVS